MIALVLGLVLLVAGLNVNMATICLEGAAIILIAGGRWLRASFGPRRVPGLGVTAIAVSSLVKRYGDFTALAGARLSGAVDLGTIRTDLAGVVHQALEPGHVWLITPAA